ncbi:aquaporin [Arthrobacter sp. PM3]|uniref:aquaporin n=1 Tax=Arthrobacter sp. PM3 TaxID=2017685 RepID=UPI000E101173|nr:aquaporin [Arthrobacter sp. PM3]AXJ10491.1 aquaporin family protein [Arthrobacter sp. PM3]
MTSNQPALWRRAVAELLGTSLLVMIVVGSGIAAQQLSPSDAGLQLLQNSTATALGLTVLILIFGPLGGAHFNPVVSLVDWALGRRSGTGLTLPELGAYAAAQTAGAISGSIIANAMFEVGTSISATPRATDGHLLGEVVATAGLILLIFTLAATRRGTLAAPAVGAYIGAAYWFTSSTSFANPAVTIGRIFTDTAAGIAPGSVPGFVLAQLIGGAVGLGLLTLLLPSAGRAANDVILPHEAGKAISQTEAVPAGGRAPAAPPTLH